MPPNEVLFVDGDSKNLIVMELQSDDKSVYFYFPFEGTFDVKKLFRFSIETLVKPNDIEPVRIGIYDDGELNSFKIGISRYHFYGLTIFINPPSLKMMNESKPVVVFANNFHTPFLWMDGKHGMVDYKIIKETGLHPTEKIATGISEGFFRSFRNGLDINSPKYYPSIVKEIKPSVIKNPSQEFTDGAITKHSNYVYLIGSSHEIELVHSKLKADFSEHVSSDNLEQFLQKIKYL